jgi:hypothetical protein
VRRYFVHMHLRRSVLALVVIAGLLASPLAMTFGVCMDTSPACDAICSAARAVVPTTDVAAGLEPSGQAPSRPALRPRLLTLAVPQPPPEPASPFL